MAKPKKILLALTGGTISSASITGARFLKSGVPLSQPLLDIYRADGGDTDKFEVVRPYHILSENLSIRHLDVLLGNIIGELNKNLYCGVVIVHGTDTLEFTRSVCKFLPEVYQFPVPIEFAYSFNTFDGFDGLNWDGYKCFKNAVEKIGKAYSENPLMPKMSNTYAGLTDDVFILKAFPDLDPDLTFGDKIKRVLIEGYHSCTAPVEPVLELAKRYRCYVCSPEIVAEKYDTTLTLEKHGVVFLAGSTTDIYAKMLLGII